MQYILRIVFSAPILILLLSEVSAQSSYSEFQLKGFSTIYLAQKEISLPCDTMIRQWLLEVNLAEERYGEILRAEVNSEDPRVTEAEKQSLALLQSRIGQCNTEHDQGLRKLCEREDLDYGVYQQMYHSYQSRVAFQRQLQPYLIAAMQAGGK